MAPYTLSLLIMALLSGRVIWWACGTCKDRMILILVLLLVFPCFLLLIYQLIEIYNETI